MKHTVKVMPSIPKATERLFCCYYFKNNDRPSHQVHLQGIAEAGKECSSFSHCIDHKLSRQLLLFFFFLGLNFSWDET